MANAYFGIRAKLAHYCYEFGRGYVCPICEEVFETEAPMEWHYLKVHNPPKEEAREIVRWNRFHRHFTDQHQNREG